MPSSNTESMIDKIFDMDAGLESEMIETKNGFLFVRVDSVNPAHTASFDSVKKSLVSDWTKAEQKKQAYVRANELLVDLNKKDGKLANKKTATVSRTDGAEGYYPPHAPDQGIWHCTAVPAVLKTGEFTEYRFF